jgi:hypothetical protein
MPVYFFQQIQAVNRMDQCDTRGNVFDFITLEVTDHVPFNIMWQQIVFGAEFLSLIFSKYALTGIVGFLNLLNWLRFADGNQPAVVGLKFCL